MRIVGDTFVRSERVPYVQTHLPHDGYGTHSPDQPYVRRRMFAKRKKLLKKKKIKIKILHNNNFYYNQITFALFNIQ